MTADRASTVAVLGTGTMGAPMARNLAGAGLHVRAWNRTREKAEALAGDGVEVADSPGEAVRGADVVLTVLSDADAVVSAFEQAAADTDDGAVWAQTATVGIEGIERCQALAEERGIALVDAPVLGTKEPAEQGALIVLAAGPKDAVGRCEPVFDAIGSRTVALGDAGEGTRLKMVLNHWILALVEGLAETVAFAEGIDIDPARFLDTISGGPLDSGYAQTKGKAMTAREFPPSFALELALKDAELVREAAGRHHLDLTLIEVIAARFTRAAEAGHGGEDLAAVIRASEPTGSK